MELQTQRVPTSTAIIRTSFYWEIGIRLRALQHKLELPSIRLPLSKTTEYGTMPSLSVALE